MFHSCPEYLLEYQYIEGQFHIHCNVYKFNSRVLRDGYMKYAELMDFARWQGFDSMYSISPNKKFCEVFGAVCIGEQKGYEVMLWDLR